MERPAAAELAKTLRQARKKRGELKASTPAPAKRALAPPPLARVVPALLSALFAGWSASALSFYPMGWPVALAVLAGLLTFFSARGGLALALLVPIFPLGNTALGLALLYAFGAILWFLLHLREPRAAFAFVLGPLLGPVSLLGLLPLALQPVRSAWRRTLQAATAVLTAALVAGLTGAALPFGSGKVGPLGLDGEGSPVNAFTTIRHVLSAHPAVLVEALALGAAAALLPYACRKGIWGIAVYGAAAIAATVLVAPHANPLPAVLTTWATCIALVLWQTRSRWVPQARPALRRPLQQLDG
jgi:hypothetical protein